MPGGYLTVKNAFVAVNLSGAGDGYPFAILCIQEEKGGSTGIFAVFIGGSSHLAGL